MTVFFQFSTKMLVCRGCSVKNGEQLAEMTDIPNGIEIQTIAIFLKSIYRNDSFRNVFFSWYEMLYITIFSIAFDRRFNTYSYLVFVRAHTFNASFIDSQYSVEAYIYSLFSPFFVCVPSLCYCFCLFWKTFGTLSFEIHRIFNMYTCVVFWHTIQSRDIVRALPCFRPVIHSLALQLRGSNANYNGERKNVYILPLLLLSPFQITYILFLSVLC